MECLKNHMHSDFPDKEIHLKLLEEKLTLSVPTPIEFAKPFELPADGFFRHWNDMFNVPEDTHNKFREWFWQESKDMLLWFQRAYASEWFSGYDPTSNDSYDTPYDWDHIMPKSHLITSGAYPNIYSTDNDLNKKFDLNRGLYVNSIGNFRLWPFWGNRSDSNNCHTDKLRMEDPDWEKDEIAKELGLNSVKDFLSASAINIEDEELWYNAGGEVRDWPEIRRIAWQEAIENRVCYLYEQLYSTFGFEAWH
jgi:hypothetical protein